MQKRQFKFTSTPPTNRSKETEYIDAGCIGLKIIVNRKGKKRFLFRYQFQELKRSLMVGEYPGVDIDTARLIANVHRKNIALGNDFKQLRDDKRNEVTFYTFAVEHYVPYATVNKLTVRNDLGILKKYRYPAWKKRSTN